MSCPPELTELLKVLYDLSPSEADVLARLCDDEATASALADEFGKDRSTVQRYLSSLRTAGLVSRRAVTEEGAKGRYYVYSVPDTEELAERIRERMERWEGEKLAAVEQL